MSVSKLQKLMNRINRPTPTRKPHIDKRGWCWRITWPDGDEILVATWAGRPPMIPMEKMK